ncbi:MAG: MurR/RpiR family transcriptional regulator [Eubacteriales bacterium]|nr:MurR/RpiR family transcriptional regulator [Eubacteriales bacterium]
MFTVEEIQSLNELELAVYEYVMQHKSTVAYMRIRELATESHVSTTTVLRFCKKMGCDGYAEFKLRMKEYIGQKQISELPEDFSEIKAFFDRMENPKFQKKLDEATALITKADRVVFIGIGNSGHIGQYGARYFTNLGKFSLYISDPFYPVNMLDTMSTVAVVLSVSGEPQQIIQIVNGLKKSGCQMIAITNSEQSTLAKLADIALTYYITMHRGENNIDFTSQIPAIHLVETLGKRVRNRLAER